MSTWHDHLYAVIIAGGQGSRLWPVSRQHQPKQLIPLLGSQSLLQQTAARLRPLVPPERTYVVTLQDYLEATRRQLPDLPAANLLAEPQPRSTAAAVSLGTAVAARRDPEAVVISLHADHAIQQTDAFRQVLRVAAQAAMRGDYLLTIGIQPTGPVTGLGYIHRDQVAYSIDQTDVYEVERFVEKPDLPTAQRFVASGEYYWNAGYFVFQARHFLAALHTHMPALAAGVERIRGAWGTDEWATALAAVYEDLEPVAIDTGVFERASNVLTVPGDFGWSDVGDWAAIQQHTPPTTGTNAVSGGSAAEFLGLDTERCLIQTSGRLIATIGLEDLVIVDTDDALLICHREHTQRVREVVDRLKAANRTESI